MAHVIFKLLKYIMHGLVLNNILTAHNFKKGQFCKKNQIHTKVLIR